MGVFSELDAAQQYGDDPFVEPTTSPPPAEQDTPAWDDPAVTVPPAFEDEARQQEEAATAPAVLAQLNQTQTSEPASPQAAGRATEQANDTDEDAKRKAHEEAEAQRKADWEARQKQKKAAMQEQLDRLAAMSDDEVMTSSMKRVSADTEKLTRRNMKDCVSEYIQTMCLDDPAFARRVMDPRKSMIHCFWYINRKAKEYVEKEMKDNDIKPENGVYGSDVPDDLCYQWALDYFNDPDAKEDQEKEEKFVPKPYAGKSTAAKGKGKKAEPKKKAEKKPAAKPVKPKPAEDDGQFSLLGVAS
ncbi:MAG: hypothetical protein HFF64_11000 [Oscillospiraceae bacterium]|nr:hypothetical protein [Oscillospiraceae bacterium]